MPRRLIAVLLAAGLLLGLGVEVAAAAKLSTRTALKKTGQVARKAARDTGGVVWFAGACKRKSRSRVDCWGGVGYADYSGCIQRVVVTRRGKLRAKRTGRTYCAELPEDASSGTSGSEGSQVVCAIRQSVCI